MLSAKAFSFEEQKRVLHSASLKRQGIWLKWSENTIPFDFSWKNLIWSSNSQIIKFVLASSINWVKTPDLLQLWGIENSGLCQLCQNAKGTLHHILSNCLVALNSKRYTWRHDSVLLHLKTALEALVEARNIKNDTAQSFSTINFVKAGAKDTKCTKPVLTPSLLQGASDWKLLVDFDQDQVTFPNEILSTNERPDIVFGRSKLEKLSLLSSLVLPKKGSVLLKTENKPDTCLSSHKFRKGNGQ